jgi:hypothetical protein
VRNHPLADADNLLNISTLGLQKGQ